jgi:hypothetical protein
VPLRLNPDQQFTSLLSFRGHPPPGDIPDDDAQRAFGAVMSSLTSEPEDPITATLRTKSEDEAGIIARRILELHAGELP